MTEKRYFKGDKRVDEKEAKREIVKGIIKLLLWITFPFFLLLLSYLIR